MRDSVGQLHDSRATGEMLGHKPMAMADWYVENATEPLRAGERRAVAKLHRNMPALAGGRIAALTRQTLPKTQPTRTNPRKNGRNLPFIGLDLLISYQFS